MEKYSQRQRFRRTPLPLRKRHHYIQQNSTSNRGRSEISEYAICLSQYTCVYL